MIVAQKGMRGFAGSFANQEISSVPDLHFIQEDCPAEIGEAIAAWPRELD